MHCMHNTSYSLWKLIRDLKNEENTSEIDNLLNADSELKEWFETENKIMSMTREQRAAQIASSPWYD